MSSQSTKHETVVKDVESCRKQPVIPDGGWGWVVCFAAACSCLIVNGLTSSSGIFLIGLKRVFDEPVSKLSLIGALLSRLSLLAAPIASMLLVYFSHRTVMILAGLIGFTGAILGVFSTSSDMMIVTYGIISGVSLGMSFFTGQIIAGLYFDKKRALAIGIANCGGGMGTLVANLLVEYLLEFYGLRGTLLLISGGLLNIVVLGSLCRPLHCVYIDVEHKAYRDLPDGTSQTSVMEDLHSDNTGNTKQKGILNETFVMPEERHNTGSLSAADNNGIKDENIIKNQKVDRSLVMKRCSNIIGVELFRNTNFVLLMVSYVLWMCFIVSLRLVLTTEVVGLEHSTKAYSILCVGSGIAGLVSTPLFGMCYDITGSFFAVFYGAGACAFIGLLFFLLIPFRNRFCVK